MLDLSATSFVCVIKAEFEADVRKAVKSQKDADFLVLLGKYFPNYNDKRAANPDSERLKGLDIAGRQSTRACHAQHKLKQSGESVQVSSFGTANKRDAKRAARRAEDLSMFDALTGNCESKSDQDQSLCHAMVPVFVLCMCLEA